MTTGREQSIGAPGQVQVVRLDEWFPLLDPSNLASSLEVDTPYNPDTFTLFPGIAVRVPTFSAPLIVEFGLDKNQAARDSRRLDVAYVDPFSLDNGSTEANYPVTQSRQPDPYEDYVGGVRGRDRMFVTGFLLPQGQPEHASQFPRLRLGLRFPDVRVDAGYEQWGGQLALRSEAFSRHGIPGEFGLLLPASRGKLSQVTASISKV